MKLIKDGRIINATQKSYDVIYKGQGYEPYEDEVEDEVAEDLEIIFDDMTKADISELLDDAGIEHNIKDNKQVLFDLLGSD